MSLADIIARRRSCRAYRGDPVPRDLIEQVLEAARQAPSACNRQPWRFAVVRDPDRRSELLKLGLNKGIPMFWAAQAPVLIVLGMQRTSLVAHRLGVWISGVDYPWMDIGIAGEHLVLRATELGLGTCWIGWIRCAALRRLLRWPRGVQPAAVIALGYPAPPATPVRPSPRKPLDELVAWL